MTTLHEFRPGLWLTELVLDSFAVRGAVIVGEQRVVVWDTLSHPRDMAAITALAEGKPIYTVYSHADWDHCWGTAGLTSEVIMAHPDCAARFATGEVARKLASMRKNDPQQWEGVVLMPPTITATTAIIEAGGVSVQLHSLAGHTRDCLVAFIPEWGILLAGDTVETPLPVLKEGGQVLDDWITQLEGWAAHDALHTVIPAHGEIGDKGVIEHTLRYLRDLAAGNQPTVPESMDEFYTATHAANLKLVE
jgi:glyoxylase-like metal-dependent hydrolase (beta-lactamase superfamily II)